MRPLCLVISLCALLMACGGRDRSGSTRVAQVPRPTLRLVAFTDLAGTLEPCGCQSKPLGGIDKAAARLEALRADGVPLLLLAAGNLLFGAKPEGASDERQAEQQETWKAGTLVEILNRLGLAAAAPGARDLVYGQRELDALAQKAKFALLPSTPRPGDAPEDVAGRVLRAGSLAVGVLGVSSFTGPDSELPPERLRALQARAQAELDRLHAEGAKLCVALISSSQRDGRRLSSALRGLDIALQGGLDEADTPAPTSAGHVVIMRAGQQGQGLLVVDVYLDGTTPLRDASEWTRREAAQSLQGRIADLASRVAGWERDPQVDPANLREQRARLAELRAELAKLQTPQVPSGNALSARFEPLTTAQHGDPQVATLMSDYDARINAYNEHALAGIMPPALPPGAAGYAGSAACQSCHAEAYAWWQKHPHGHAYTTLQNVHKQFNLSCVACHVTGYMRPGGASIVHNEGLIHVGCESCHGPGSLHAAHPDRAPQLTRVPGETTCRQCHTPEHSDLFEYATYEARLRAPGHGLPAH